jgi:hypothetical protein
MLGVLLSGVNCFGAFQKKSEDIAYLLNRPAVGLGVYGISRFDKTLALAACGGVVLWYGYHMPTSPVITQIAEVIAPHVQAVARVPPPRGSVDFYTNNGWSPVAAGHLATAHSWINYDVPAKHEKKVMMAGVGTVAAGIGLMTLQRVWDDAFGSSIKISN